MLPEKMLTALIRLNNSDAYVRICKLPRDAIVRLSRKGSPVNEALLGLINELNKLTDNSSVSESLLDAMAIRAAASKRIEAFVDESDVGAGDEEETLKILRDELFLVCRFVLDELAETGTLKPGYFYLGRKEANILEIVADPPADDSVTLDKYWE